MQGQSLLLPQHKHRMTCTLDEHLKLSFPLTCEVEDLGPLFADVDTDVRPSNSQVGSALVKHEGLYLKQKKNTHNWNETKIKGNLDKRGMETKTIFNSV